MNVTVRHAEVIDLEDALRYAAEHIVAEEKKVVSKGALNIKRDWARSWKRLGPHITDLPRTISYDLDVDKAKSTISAEVGPDKDLEGTQAPLANVIEYGTLRTPAHPAGAHALEAEEERFVQSVGDVAVKVLEKR